MTEQHPLNGKRVLMFVGDLYEDLELWYPRIRLQEAGAEVVAAGPEAGAAYTGKHGYPAESDAAVGDVDPSDFDGVVIPGGFMPDRLRRDEDVKEAVRVLAAGGRLVAAICHGGWIPISAGVYEGIRATGSEGIRDDLENAGAIWEDSEVVVDGNFISSRSPRDLPAFCRAIIAFLSGDE